MKINIREKVGSALRFRCLVLAGALPCPQIKNNNQSTYYFDGRFLSAYQTKTPRCLKYLG